MLQTVRVEKVEGKNWPICLISLFPSWVMICKLSKKRAFFTILADFRKKSKSVNAVYISASESSLSENAVVYRSLRHSSRDISD